MNGSAEWFVVCCSRPDNGGLTKKTSDQLIIFCFKALCLFFLYFFLLGFQLLTEFWTQTMLVEPVGLKLLYNQVGLEKREHLEFMPIFGFWNSRSFSVSQSHFSPIDFSCFIFVILLIDVAAVVCVSNGRKYLQIKSFFSNAMFCWLNFQLTLQVWRVV